MFAIELPWNLLNAFVFDMNVRTKRKMPRYKESNAFFSSFFCFECLILSFFDSFVFLAFAHSIWLRPSAFLMLPSSLVMWCFLVFCYFLLSNALFLDISNPTNNTLLNVNMGLSMFCHSKFPTFCSTVDFHRHRRRPSFPIFVDKCKMLRRLTLKWIQNEESAATCCVVCTADTLCWNDSLTPYNYYAAHFQVWHLKGAFHECNVEVALNTPQIIFSSNNIYSFVFQSAESSTQHKFTSGLVTNIAHKGL